MYAYLELGNRRRILGELHREGDASVWFVPVSLRHHHDAETLRSTVDAAAKRGSLHLRAGPGTGSKVARAAIADRTQRRIAVRIFVEGS